MRADPVDEAFVLSYGEPFNQSFQAYRRLVMGRETTMERLCLRTTSLVGVMAGLTWLLACSQAAVTAPLAPEPMPERVVPAAPLAVAEELCSIQMLAPNPHLPPSQRFSDVWSLPKGPSQSRAPGVPERLSARRDPRWRLL